MAVNNPVHVNEGGLPLNAIEWLEVHHRSKAPERERMIRDIQFKRGSNVVDAGCGPGLWTPLLARAIGLQGYILGVDIPRSFSNRTPAQSRQVVPAAGTVQTQRFGPIASAVWNGGCHI